MAFSTAHPLSSTRALAERAFRQPSTMIWLSHVCLTTSNFDASLAFYVGTLGLQLRTVEAHPLFHDRLRALLIDAEGHDVLELLEVPAGFLDPAHRAFHQISFKLPQRTSTLLRARLSAHDVTYQEHGGDLYFQDVDGTHVRVQPLAS